MIAIMVGVLNPEILLQGFILNFMTLIKVVNICAIFQKFYVHLTGTYFYEL